MPLSSFAGALELAQGASEGLDFVFVGILLPFGQLERLEHFLHLFECLPESLENVIDLFDGLFDARGRSRPRLASRRGRSIEPVLGRSRPARGLRSGSRLSGPRTFRLWRSPGAGGGFAFFRRLRFSGRLGPFNRLKFLSRLRPQRRSGRPRGFFLLLIRDGGFGRILGSLGGFSGRRRLGRARGLGRRVGALCRRRPGFALDRQRGLGPGWSAPSSAPAASVERAPSACRRVGWLGLLSRLYSAIRFLFGSHLHFKLP